MCSMETEVEDSHMNNNANISDGKSDQYPKINLESPKEWVYTMRRHMQEVTSNLFLGPYSAASKTKLDYLLENGITHIVCIRQNIEAQFIKPNFPERFRYLVLDVADCVTENIIQHFRTVKAFIDEAVMAGGKVLVHGNAGISRSAAFVLAYIMETYGLTFSKAYVIVQQRRFCINPNDGFMAQLKEYEPIYQAQREVQNRNLSCDTRRFKRTIHMTEENIDENIEAMVTYGCQNNS